MQTELDRNVGKIAGAIYSSIADRLACAPLPLLPAVTFKVKKVLESVTDMTRLEPDQKVELARDVRIAVIPMLFSYEIDPDVIEKVTSTIETAALDALQNKGG